uniref:VPS8 subunit of CORVET complex n=1 Tax=Hucho hucho TaxID=62062 RepID=A0A4W5K385_9TELE
ARGVFLESLEPYIVSERLGCVTAHVMRDLLTHLQDNNMMDSVENCLIHLDITSLDIQQVVQMCWDNQLYDAMIYVFNSGMNDYINPMEECVNEVFSSLCVAVRSVLMRYPPLSVFEFLIRLHSAEAGQEEELYPYIRTLLHFDTPEFLNVLALTFEDFKNDKQALEYQQRIVDILLKVMVENSDFTPSQVGCLFTFLARQLAKPDNTLFVNRKLFDQVLEFLCSPDDDSRHTERQQVLLELLQVGGVVQFDEGRLLELAEKAEFYQICEFLYEQKHMFDKILDCYLRDPLRKEEIFNYIHNLLSMPGYSSEEKHCVWDKALLHIAELVTLDPAKSADLVAMHFSEEVRPIITRLQDDHLVFQFLRSLLDQSATSREGPHPQALLRLSPDLHELHIGLLCRFTPRQLTDFLKASQDYRLEEAIQITEQYQLHEATAYLLEKKGDSHGAFQVLLKTLKDKLSAVTSEKRSEEEGETEREEESPLQRVEESLGDIIALCHRSSQSLNQEQRGVLWFPLLEAMMSPQKLLKGPDACHTSEVLKELTMKVLNSMSSFIPLPAIIQRILQTLLETTTSLLNHDLHWSLSHLRAAVSKGLHPRQDHCNICLQQYKRRQDSPDEIIIFSCGHLYHCQCLQRKGSGHAEPRLLQVWSCYKCISSQRGRGGDRVTTETGRGRSTSLAQVSQ